MSVLRTHHGHTGWLWPNQGLTALPEQAIRCGQELAGAGKTLRRLAVVTPSPSLPGAYRKQFREEGLTPLTRPNQDNL